MGEEHRVLVPGSGEDLGVGEGAGRVADDAERLVFVPSQLGDQVDGDPHVEQELHEAIGSAGSTCSSASQAAYRMAWLTSSVSR